MPGFNQQSQKTYFNEEELNREFKNAKVEKEIVERVHDVNNETNFDASVTLEDIDATIEHQFTNVFDFHVTQNNQLLRVPIVYDKNERWVWARKQTHLKTIQDKILLPLIVYSRSTIARDTQKENQPTLNILRLGNNNISHITKSYSKTNRYDRFSALNNIKPSYEYKTMHVPSFINLSYEFNIYTEYMYQMNPIVEQIMFHGNEYWGNKDKLLFKAKADNFSVATEDGDTSRYVKCSFTLEVSAYIVPNTIAHKSNMQTSRTVSKIIVNEHVVNNISDLK